jgi:hypothetical protein
LSGAGGSAGTMRAGGFEFSRKEQAMKVHGTEDDGHPRVARIRRGRSTTWPGYRPPSRGRRNPDLVAETTVASPEETVAWMLEALRKAGRLP